MRVTQDMVFTVALRFEDYTFHASGQRVENCSSRYKFLNNERDGANSDIVIVVVVFRSTVLRNRSCSNCLPLSKNPRSRTLRTIYSSTWTTSRGSP